MTTACLNLLHLHAANQAASNEETRYYLNGVCLEITRDHITYVATDGHILFAYQDVGQAPHELTGTFIVPSATIKLAKLDAKTRKYPYATLRQIENGKLELVTLGDGPNFVFAPIDGTFPEWRRVVPRVADCKPAQYAPALLARLWKAGELISAEKPTLVQNGSGPGHVVYSNGMAFGLIMPRRGDVDLDKPHDAPGWIVDQPQMKVAA